MKMDASRLSDLDLAALLCSRVCHDVISPVGAIANGLEILEEENDTEMRQIAMDLVSRSARQASAKLQFCRMAFGAAGSAGAHIDLGEAGDVARMFIGDEKVTLDWQAPRETRDKSEVKLLLNMMLIAVASIPRGGQITVTADAAGLTARATGVGARIADNAADVLTGSTPGDQLDARLVQVYYSVRLAEQAGYALSAAMDGEDAVVRAVPRAAAAVA